MPEEIARPGRRTDLEWIRITAFGLLILYHVGVLLVAWDFRMKSEHIVPGENRG